MDLYDLTIIGSGPVGLFAAFYAGMRQAKTKVIDSLPQLGGQLTTLYPEKYIYDIAGFPKVKAGDLIHNLEHQLESFPHTYCLNEEVQQVIPIEVGFKIITDQETHYSKAIILAVGNGAFTPRKLPLDNAATFEGAGLTYYVGDLDQYQNKVVAITGGGDSAIDWALTLEPIAKEVHLIHRRDKFRAHEHTVEQLNRSKVIRHTPFTITALLGDEELNQIQLSHAKSKELMTLPVDSLIVNYGYQSSLSHLNDWGIETDRQGVLVYSDMSTSVPGIYACGDSCSYQGKVNLIATGFGEAPTAVNNALHYLDPEIRQQPKHSTSLFS